MTLFYRLFKLFIFVIITPLFVTGVFLFYYQNYNKTEVLNNYYNIAQISAQFIQQNVENASLRLGFANEILRLYDQDKTQAQTRLNDALEDNADFVFLALLDKHGTELLRAGTKQMLQLVSMVDLSQDESLLTLTTDTIAISGFDDNLTFPFVEVVYPAANGRYVFAVMSVYNIWDKLAAQRIGLSGGIYFATPTNGLLDITTPALVPPIAPAVLAPDLKGPKNIIKEIRTEMGDVLVGAVSATVIPDTYICVLQYRKEAFYTINLISWLIAFFILVTTTLSYFAALAFSEEVSDPIEELARAAAKIADNDFNVNLPADRNAGEFGLLMQAFNAMAAKLGEYKTVQIDKLLDEKKKTDLLASLMRDGIVMCTPQGTLLFANGMANKILNSDTLCTMVQCTSCGDMAKPELKALFSLPSGTIFAYQAGGQTAYFEMISETFKPAKDESVILMVFRDITTEHEVNEMKSDIFNSVAHDLRAPLLGLQAYLMVLKEGSLNEQEQKRALVSMENSARTLTVLVENILDISKLERGLIMLNRAPVNLADIVSQTIDSLSPLADRKNIKLINAVAPGIMISVDRHLIERVFLNLISNSIKFTDSGAVSITYLATDKHNITIADSGIGIDEDQLSKIFVKYHQIDQNVKGYGLGLTIVRQIIIAHNGDIWAKSPDHKGLEITFTLPKD